MQKYLHVNRIHGFLKKYLLVVIFFVAQLPLANATVANYTFAYTSGTFVALTGGTTFLSGSWDDGSSALLTIPFSFNYNGTSYTTLSINANGFITMGVVNADVYCGLQQSVGNSIAGYGTDLFGSATSSIKYGSRGSSPNRQYVIEWNDCDHYGNSNQNHWTFQIILNETSNTIQVVWGSVTQATTLGANTCSDSPAESGNVGLLGAMNTDFNIRSITNGSQTWATSILGANLSSVCNMSSTNVPASGATFTWTPGAVLPMSFTSCTTAFLNNGQAVSQNALGDQIIQVQVVTTGTTSPFNLTSLSLSTTGCTNASTDITNAKVYFTGNSNTFSSATQFGSTSVGPNGAYTVTGSATLSEGTNYFWVTYDIKPAAVLNDVLKGCCTQIIGSGTMGTRVPTITCPTGSQTIASIGTWTQVTTTAPNPNGGVMLVLSDGTIICKTQSGGASVGNIWNKLTPNSSGSYINGTWSSIAPMIDTRLYFSSQVMKDGRVYVAGGEYGTGGSVAEVYDPLTNVWTATTTTPGNTVSDANSAILEDGRIVQALVAGNLKGNVIFNPATNSYTAGPSCIGIHNESSWVKLPDNSILFIDRLSTNSERYIPATNTWIADATVPGQLYDSFGLEFGTALLLPDGRAFFVGATGKTAYYTPTGTTSPGTWALGPDVPGANGQPDAPGAMMVNGKILLSVSPIPTNANHFPTPTTFYEFDYLTNTYTLIPAPGGAASLNISCYVTNFTDLPDGKVLYSRQGSSTYYVYTPAGSPLVAGKPTISSVIANGCSTYKITGTKFNGISEGACYGDDWQMATNYPIIRLSSGSNVYYVRTSNWNSTGVMRGAAADTTTFTVPATIPNGTYNLVVTANGIASDPVSFTVTTTASLTSTLTPAAICSGSTFTYTPTSNFTTATFTWTRAAVAGISNAAVTVPQSSNPNEVLINTTNAAINVVYSYTINANGCTTNTQSVTVSVKPIPTVSVNSPSACSGASSTLTATPSIAGGTYLWTTGSQTTAAINVAPTTSTTYSVTYTLTGCSTSSAGTVTVTPNLATVTNASISPSQCSNSSISIPYTVNCNYTSGNIFTAQLSNSSGSFASPVTLGTLTATGSGTISGFIPNGTAAGTGYRIRIVTSNPVTTGNNNGSNITISTCGFSFNVKLIIQGFYAGSGTMRATVDPVLYPTVCDTVKIELHNSTSPYALADVATSTINLTGTGSFSFAASSLGNQYYIVIKHRNALETWSASPVTMTSGGTYDFSTALNKAFGNNQVNVSAGVFAIWSGDVTNGVTAGLQDGFINEADFTTEQSILTALLTAYDYRDLSGDKLIESSDYSLIENNVKLNISRMKP